MKYLILTLSLASLTGPVQAQKVKELSNEALNKKMISVVKDAEVDKQLGEVEIFKKCRDMNKFDPALLTDDSKVKTNLNAAVNCFKQELGKGQDEKKLLEMADRLNLQGYGLIQSKNVKDITKYLGNKMYKAMTGVDKDAADLKTAIANMRFNNPNKKMIDQRDFIDLYQTQLGKNALFEISRFCFEDFRNNTETTQADFSSHWKTYFDGGAADLPISNVTDVAKKRFLKSDTNKDTIGDDIYEGIGKNLNTGLLSKFFTFCGNSIKPLCDNLKTSSKVTNNLNGVVETSKSAIQITGNKVDSTPGSKACLTLSRLEEYRKGIAATAKVAEDFDKMSSQDMAIQLDKGELAKFYDQGKSNQSNSIDNLTNFSSKDILEGGLDKNVDYAKLKAECGQDPSKDECEQFLAIDDSLQKAEHNLDMDLQLKKEIQLARVRKAKTDSDLSVEKYLEQEGYLDLLAKFKDPAQKSSINLEEEIAKIFEAKRLSALENLKASVGRRQVSEDESKKATFDKKSTINDNIIESQDERARLAQVVLFNNIITSNLDLYSGPKGKEKKLGQNTNAWKVEQDSRSGKSKTDPSLFTQLKADSADKKSVDTSGTSVVGLGMLDTILGKPK
jgi:hypothetical protein